MTYKAGRVEACLQGLQGEGIGFVIQALADDIHLLPGCQTCHQIRHLLHQRPAHEANFMATVWRQMSYAHTWCMYRGLAAGQACHRHLLAM